MMDLTALGVWDRKNNYAVKKNLVSLHLKGRLPGAQKILKICICLLQLFIQTGTECGFALVSSKKRNFCTLGRGSENQK